MDLFFFDVDGTLLDNQHHRILDGTLSALRSLQAKGKKLVIASGRGKAGIDKIDELKKIVWDGYVLYNGALCLDQKQNILYQHFFSRELVEKLIQASRESGTQLYCLGTREWLSAPLDEYGQKAFAFFHRSAQELEIHPLSADDSLSMVLTFGSADSSYLAYRKIPGLKVLATPHYYADINDEASDKAVGMRKIAEFLNIPMSRTMAFGDGINDLEMISAAQIGVAMGQGDARIKQAADYVTAAVDDEGILKALRHFNETD